MLRHRLAGAAAILVPVLILFWLDEYRHGGVPGVWLVPLGTALINPQLTFLTLVAAYLLSGPVMWLRQRRTLRLQQS